MKVEHLTDEQFTDLLCGSRTLAVDDHLKGCERCQSELERVQVSIESFGAASLEWAELRASQRILAPSRMAHRWYAVPVWSAMAATLMLGAVLLELHEDRLTQAPAVVQMALQEPAETPASLEDDNRLMMEIDSEVRKQHASAVPLSELQVSAKSERSQAHRTIN